MYDNSVDGLTFKVQTVTLRDDFTLLKVDSAVAAKNKETRDRHIDHASWSFRQAEGREPALVLDFAKPAMHSVQEGELSPKQHFLGGITFFRQRNSHAGQSFLHSAIEGQNAEYKITVEGAAPIRQLARWLTKHNQNGRNDAYLAVIPEGLGGKREMKAPEADIVPSGGEKMRAPSGKVATPSAASSPIAETALSALNTCHESADRPAAIPEQMELGQGGSWSKGYAAFLIEERKRKSRENER